MSKSRLLFLAILNIIGFLGTVVVNGLSSALPINGKTAGELSDQYPNLFVPTGLTFSVWGVIYILLAIFVLSSLYTDWLSQLKKMSKSRLSFRMSGYYSSSPV